MNVVGSELSENLSEHLPENLPENPEKRSPRLAVLGEAAIYAAAFLVTLIFFFLIKPYFYVAGTKGVIAQAIVALSLVSCVLLGIWWKWKQKLTVKKLIGLLLVAGLFLRIGYMLSTPPTYRQHDLYFGKDYGHEGYAWQIFSTGKLPSSNYNQLYHPPLNALLQAGFMHIMSGLEKGLSSLFKLDNYFVDNFLYGKPDTMSATRYALYSTCQILSVFYSFVVCVVSLKILTLFGIKGKPLVALSAFMIFYPRGIHFAASLNNDGVAYMFSVMALYFALKWWKKGKRLPDILLCAASIGLGMMSKLSSATVCLPVAGVFIYEFVRTLKKKEDALTLKNMIVQYATFLIICAPLGLWFQVYAKIRFDQSFGYVFSGITSKLSTADRTLFQRLFPIAFDAKEYFSSLWCNTFTTATSPNNYNLFHFALRSSIFGEQTYSRGESFAIPAVIFAYIAVILLLISLIRAVYLYIRYDRKRSDEGAIEGRKNALFVLLLVASQVLSEIYFYIKMPYACTMDFRYIMPLILGMCLTLWLVCGRLSRAGDGFSVTLCRLTVLSVAAFLVCSVLFYAVCV